MRKHQIKLAVFIMLLIFNVMFSSACVVPLGGLFRSYSCVSTVPEQTQIIGVWIPDKATLEDIRIRGRYNHTVSTKLIFRADGSFEMENMPDWWRSDFGEPHGGFESQKGTWKLSNTNNCFYIDLNLSNLGTVVNLLESRFGGKPKYIIEIILGDPDSGEKMIFVKQ